MVSAYKQNYFIVISIVEVWVNSRKYTSNFYRGYREFTGFFGTLYRVLPVTGKTFNISRKSLSIWQGIPVKVPFPVDFIGKPCYIYSYITKEK